MVGAWTCWCYPVRKHAPETCLSVRVYWIKLVKRTNQRHACRLHVNRPARRPTLGPCLHASRSVDGRALDPAEEVLARGQQEGVRVQRARHAGVAGAARGRRGVKAQGQPHEALVLLQRGLPRPQLVAVSVAPAQSMWDRSVSTTYTAQDFNPAYPRAQAQAQSQEDDMCLRILRAEPRPELVYRRASMGFLTASAWLTGL